MNDILFSLTSVDLGGLAAWDLESFLGNSESLLRTLGAAVLGVLGVALLIMAAYYIFLKFTSEQGGQKHGWPKIIIMFIIAGAFLVGGFTLLEDIASGGNTTLEDLG